MTEATLRALLGNATDLWGQGAAGYRACLPDDAPAKGDGGGSLLVNVRQHPIVSSRASSSDWASAGALIRSCYET